MSVDAEVGGCAQFAQLRVGSPIDIAL